MRPTLLARLCIMSLALVSFSGVAQTPAGPAAKLPAYDVATIRPSNPGRSFHVSVSVNDNLFQAENVTLKDLLQDAFGVQRNLLFGLPTWAESDRFDINAKILDADPKQLRALKPEQWRAMFLALYQDRFGLKWHYETRTLPAYELSLTKDGPKFAPSAPHTGSDGTSRHNTDLTITNMPMLALVQALSPEVERPIVDKTGLTANYDMHLRWTREGAANAAAAGSDLDAPPALFTALQEQLGLKLQAAKDPVQVVVIDSLTPPTAN
jgi:uncharacterized protein (TIGR03435 family)